MTTKPDESPKYLVVSDSRYIPGQRLYIDDKGSSYNAQHRTPMDIDTAERVLAQARNYFSDPFVIAVDWTRSAS